MSRRKDKMPAKASTAWEAAAPEPLSNFKPANLVVAPGLVALFFARPTKFATLALKFGTAPSAEMCDALSRLDMGYRDKHGGIWACRSTSNRPTGWAKIVACLRSHNFEPFWLDRSAQGMPACGSIGELLKLEAPPNVIAGLRKADRTNLPWSDEERGALVRLVERKKWTGAEGAVALVKAFEKVAGYRPARGLAAELGRLVKAGEIGSRDVSELVASLHHMGKTGELEVFAKTLPTHEPNAWAQHDENEPQEQPTPKPLQVPHYIRPRATEDLDRLAKFLSEFFAGRSNHPAADAPVDYAIDVLRKYRERELVDQLQRLVVAGQS